MQHCANIRGADPASVDACKKIMEDLSTLNSRVGDFLQSEHVTMVRTGDMLTGRMDCPIAQYMDTLYDLWGSDTVHGDKLAYSKIAIGLLDSLNRNLPETDLRHNLQSRKRSLDASPDVQSRREDSIPRRFSERQGGTSGGYSGGGGGYSGGGNRSDRELHRRDSYQSNTDDPHSGYRSNRDSSAFSTYPGDNRMSRDQTPRRFGGRGGSRRLDY
jgi:hypothetical protein